MISPLEHIRLITAGAGSGKTTRVAAEVAAGISGGTAPEQIIVTTFTNKAAAELRSRIQGNLIEAGRLNDARRVQRAMVGTVNSVCGSLVSRFAFDLGLSASVSIIDDSEGKLLIRRTLGTAVPTELQDELNRLSRRLSQDSAPGYGSRGTDWRSDVSRIMDFARSNGISAEGLHKSAALSERELRDALPPQSTVRDDLLNRLETSMTHVLSAIPDNDTTEATKGVRSRFDITLGRLQSNRDAVSWQELSQISSVKPGAKSRVLFESAQLIAAEIESCEEFGVDLMRYMRACFEAAEQTLEAYDRAKREAGAIDFTDQEELLLWALERDAVRREIAASFELLVVDEFQDTSPIQLALFMKFAEIGVRVVWVGDPKQSIYGFRGADPSLTLAVLDQLPRDARDTLKKSYRSRPELVHFHNTVFTPAFSSSMPGLPVALEPDRTNAPSLPPALQLWQFPYDGKRRRIDLFLDDLGGWLRQNLEDGTFGDTEEHIGSAVAILCRGNTRCQQVAVSLERAGLPVAVEREGLVETPELILISAALRYAADPRDALAISELRLLAEDHEDATEIVRERLADPEGWAAGEVASLVDSLRDELRSMSAAAAVDTLISRLSVHRILHRFGWPDLSSACIEKIRRLVHNYASRFVERGEPADISAIVRELDRLADTDNNTLPLPADDRAIQVLTYHRAKGLEWPTVIALDLEDASRNPVFGIEMARPQTDIDILDPLAGRLIRFWPDPGIAKESELATALGEHDATQERWSRESAERQRLLYVGLTRARDYLVLPVRRTARGEARLTWLMDVLSAGSEPGEIPDANGVFDWQVHAGGQAVRVEVSTLPADVTSGSETTHEQVELILPPRGAGTYPSLLVNPSLESDSAGTYAAEAAAPAIRITEHTYSTPLNVVPSSTPADLGNAVHAVLARSAGLNRAADIQEIAQTLRRFGAEGVVAPDELREQTDAFLAWVATRVSNPRFEIEPTAYMSTDGQLVSARLDLLISGESDLWIVDHKAIAMVPDVTAVAMKYATQLGWYRRIVQVKPDCDMAPRTWLHLVLQGIMVELHFDGEATR